MKFKKILPFNVDFRFSPVHSAYPKFVEINVDNLSRYNIAQNVGIYPRKIRYENIKRHALQAGANLLVLYNTSFLNDISKARRWGVNDIHELSQPNFYSATSEDIERLEKRVNLDKNENWILFLSVYTIPHLSSHFSADDIIRDTHTQYSLKKLVNTIDENTLLIGTDIPLDKICNDKFLTSKFISDEYQPKSSLIINGLNPEFTLSHLLNEVNSDDIVIKPVGGHSGLGIIRGKNSNELYTIFQNLSQARKFAEQKKITNRFNTDNTYDYLINTMSYNPFLHCQGYVPTVKKYDRELTYRAVVTAYVDNSNEIDIEFECIYPKKANENDFKSNILNPVTKDEVLATMYNEKLVQALMPGLKIFVRKILDYNEHSLINNLLSGTETEQIKGLQLISNRENAVISSENKDKIKNFSNSMIHRSPQAFENIHGILKNNAVMDRASLSTFNSIFKTTNDPGFSNHLYSNISILSENQRTIVSQNKPLNDSIEFLMIKFIAACDTLKKYFHKLAYTLSSIIYSEELYSKISEVLYYNEILMAHNYCTKLIVVINFFEIKNDLKHTIADQKIRNLFTINHVTEDPLLQVFINSTDENYQNIPSQILVKALLKLSDLTEETLAAFPKSINGYLLSDYSLKLSQTLYHRYQKDDFFNRDNLLFRFYVSWCGNQLTTFTLDKAVSFSEWQLRSQSTELLRLCSKEIEISGKITLNSICDFLHIYLANKVDKFALFKSIEFLNTLIKLDRNLEFNSKKINNIYLRYKDVAGKLNLSDAYFDKITASYNECLATFKERKKHKSHFPFYGTKLIRRSSNSLEDPHPRSQNKMLLLK